MIGLYIYSNVNVEFLPNPHLINIPILIGNYDFSGAKPHNLIVRVDYESHKWQYHWSMMRTTQHLQDVQINQLRSKLRFALFAFKPTNIFQRG